MSSFLFCLTNRVRLFSNPLFWYCKLITDKGEEEEYSIFSEQRLSAMQYSQYD